MKFKKYYLLAFCSLLASSATWSQRAYVSGKITDEDGKPVDHATIAVLSTDEATLSDSAGHFFIAIPVQKKVALTISNVLYEKEPFNIHNAKEGDTIKKNITLRSLDNILTTVEIKDQRFRQNTGDVQVLLKNVDINPGPIGGVEGLIKTLVGSNNELTSQYTVRGGNYDENLVYVNDFEIYRPFLVRSGQQEGLSFVNSDLADRVSFSIGGFQSRYGDKMSSVLDVTYKKPEKFGGSVMLSFLGAQAHLEGATRNKKLTYLIGARQKSNQYLLQSQPTKGQYNPSFTDIQGLVNYKLSNQWEVEVIANYARNRFNFVPEESESAFGLVNKILKLRTVFNGSERDQFDSKFGGLSIAYRPTKKTKIKVLGSAFQTNEFETYDIQGEYGFYEVESDLGKQNLGQEKYSLGTGIIHDFARNYLTATVGTVAIRASHDLNKHYIQWGVDGTLVNVDDQLLEWQRRDSAGFSQPYDTSQILMAKSYESHNNLEYKRFSAFLQDNILLGDNATLNLGVRANYTDLNEEFIISPRASFSLKPNWKRDVVLRLATGLYAQPPFYREMRAVDGTLNTGLKAQKSFHLAGGFDYNFIAFGNRTFKVTAELYYKSLWDLVPYEYDNVRIRYYANNNAKGYAYGGELRLYGNLVQDAESWISLNYLKTENQFLDPVSGQYSDYIARPTDQRISLGMFFSDYLPRNKNFKMYLNLMYATGLPFSPVGKSLDPQYQMRIPDYKRVDIGFSALLIDGAKKNKPAHSFFSAFKSVWLSAEVFNLLGIQNTLSYQWIQDYSTDRIYAVPNRLTSRLINLKLACKF